MEPKPRTPEQQALEDEIARRRAKREAELAEAEAKRGTHKEDPEKRDAIMKTAADIAKRLGRLPLTWEELNAAEPTNTPAEELHRRKMEKRHQRFEILCPKAYRDAWNWELVKPEVDRDQAKLVMGWQYGPRGLYVCGESGHSKTRAVFQLLRRLVLQEGRKPHFLDGIEFSMLCTRAFGDPAQTQQLLRPLVTADLLVIDDLAKRWTPATEEGAFYVLEKRTAQELPVIVTLNYTAADLHAMQQARGELAQVRDLSTPLIRRLVDFCEPVVL